MLEILLFTFETIFAATIVICWGFGMVWVVGKISKYIDL